MFTYVSKGKPSEFGFIPAGVYLATVTGVEEKTSKSGNQMLVVDFLAVASDGTSTTVKYYLTHTDASVWKIDAFLYAIGMTPQAGQTVTLMPNQLMGKKCYIKVGVEEGDQRDFNNCENVLSEEAALIAIAEQNRVASLPKQAGYSANRAPSVPVSRPVPPRQAEFSSAPTEEDDDIPF